MPSGGAQKQSPAGQPEPARPEGRWARIAAWGIVLSPFIAGVLRTGGRRMQNKPPVGHGQDARDETGNAEPEPKIFPAVTQSATRAASDAAALQPTSERSFATTEALRKGWHRPRPGKIPHPTYAPATVALGIACLLWGLVTTPIISLIGAALFVIGLAAWIGDLRHER